MKPKRKKKPTMATLEWTLKDTRRLNKLPPISSDDLIDFHFKLEAIDSELFLEQK